MNIMIDIETLGLGKEGTPVILQIGWCMFDNEKVHESKSFYLDFQEQLDDPMFHVNADTLMWWMQQDKARNTVFSYDVERVDLRHALSKLSNDLMNNRTNEGGQLWCLHELFDLQIIKEANCDEFPLWTHKQPQDMETLILVGEKLGVDWVEPEIPHDAESDAIAQAQYVINVFKKVDDMKTGIALS